MLMRIPVIGWLLGFLVAFFLSIPFYFIWNALAPTYFGWLPAVWLNIPFWHMVGLFMIFSVLRFTLLPSVTASATVEK
jgi:hypothetical protein